MDIKAVQADLRRFARERDWEKFHSPKNLAMGVAAEAGELVAEFQWLGTEESSSPAPDRLARVRNEVADVAIHLLRLCDVLGIDLKAAITDKIRVNEERYPVHLSKGNAKKYTEFGS